MLDAYTYLDHAATTPLRSEVAEAMVECWAKDFGNPSSLHRPGRQARSRLEEARTRVAEETIRDWLKAYRRGGFEALLPKPRADRGQSRSLPPQVLDVLLAELKGLSKDVVKDNVTVNQLLPERLDTK